MAKALSNNLMNPMQSKRRYWEKEAQVLRFLRDETYSTAPILGKVMGLQSTTAMNRSLKRMESHGVIQNGEVVLVEGALLKLWGITTHGLALSHVEDEAHQDRPVFHPKRVRVGQLQHTLDIQKIRVAAEKQGWTNWMSSQHVLRSQNARLADALATHPNGLRVAIEVERTLKSQRRYGEIIGSYLSLINQEEIDAVYYICPIERIKRVLEKIIRGLESVCYDGHWGKVDASYFERFYFSKYMDWRS